MKKIGIVPPGKLYEDNMPHHNLYSFANPYVQRIAAQNAAPIGILPMDGHVLPDTLVACDGFLIAGGTKLWPYHLQVVAHAVMARKPLLGICLGMQAIAAYFQVAERMQTDGAGLAETFDRMKKERFMFNLPVPGHYLRNVTREGTQGCRHTVIIRERTRLFEAVGRRQMDAVSLHSYQVAPVPAALTISATAPDGTIEGIEHGGFIVGVQFHPEVDDDWDALFAAFIHGEWTAFDKPPFNPLS